MTRVYIGGNIYGAGNIGDDAVLQGIFSILKNIDQEMKFIVGTHDKKCLDFLPNDVNYINSYDMREVKSTIKSCNCFISGGGTMIGDELSSWFPLQYNAHLISLAKCYRKKASLIAIGANQIKHSQNAALGKTIIKLSDLITLRDKESRNVCLKLGAKEINTFTTADPAFILHKKETLRTKKIKTELLAKGKVFGVNMVNEAWADLTGYKYSIAEACNYLYLKYGYIPVFFCNEVRPGKYFDYEANKNTISQLKTDYVLLDPVYYTPEEMIDIISIFNFVIGMRMHSLIFSAINGIPFIGISRIDKMDNFFNQFCLQPSGYIHDCNSTKIINDIEHRLQNEDYFKKEVLDRIDVLKSRFFINIELIGKLLDSKSLFCFNMNSTSAKILIENNTFCKKVTKNNFLVLLKKIIYKVTRRKK